MNVTPIFRKSFATFGTECMVSTAPLLARSEALRYSLLLALQKYVQVARTPTIPSFPRPVGVTQDLSEFSPVIWHTADRILTHHLSRPVLRNVGRNLISGIMVEKGQQSAISQFHQAYGINPPGFLTISPGKTCNLRCTGCYANAGADSEAGLENLRPHHPRSQTLWVSLHVISGGEPLAYRSEGKGVLDAAEKHPDVFFLMYTNGTLINETVANRLAAWAT